MLNHDQNLPDDIYLSLGRIESAHSSEVLNHTELDEYHAIANEGRKHEFLSARVLLKNMWRQLAGSDPALTVLKDDFGKPYGKTAREQIYLSLAHSKHRLLGGISKEREIGVDLEPAGRQVDERLGKRIYHPEEADDIRLLPLVRLWTIKEALVKLHGGGLRTNLKDVEVRQDTEHEFSGIFDNDKTAIICSFQQQDHWLAVAYYR